jgi:glycosyltransferase involved in cell wall biosynthesis
MLRGGESAGRVQVVGKVSAPTLAAYYHGALATVIPSRADSLPLVFSEAVQCGSPLIVYDTGDLGHFVRRFRLGRVVQPGDVRSLSQALVECSTGGEAYSGAARVAIDMLHPARAARKFLRLTEMKSGERTGTGQKNARVRFRPDRGG